MEAGWQQLWVKGRLKSGEAAERRWAEARQGWSSRTGTLGQTDPCCWCCRNFAKESGQGLVKGGPRMSARFSSNLSDNQSGNVTCSRFAQAQTLHLTEPVLRKCYMQQTSRHHSETLVYSSIYSSIADTTLKRRKITKKLLATCLTCNLYWLLFFPSYYSRQGPTLWN